MAKQKPYLKQDVINSTVPHNENLIAVLTFYGYRFRHPISLRQIWMFVRALFEVYLIVLICDICVYEWNWLFYVKHTSK